MMAVRLVMPCFFSTCVLFQSYYTILSLSFLPNFSQLAFIVHIIGLLLLSREEKYCYGVLGTYNWGFTDYSCILYNTLINCNLIGKEVIFVQPVSMGNTWVTKQRKKMIDRPF